MRPRTKKLDTKPLLKFIQPSDAKLFTGVMETSTSYYSFKEAENYQYLLSAVYIVIS